MLSQSERQSISQPCKQACRYTLYAPQPQCKCVRAHVNVRYAFWFPERMPNSTANFIQMDPPHPLHYDMYSVHCAALRQTLARILKCNGQLLSPPHCCCHQHHHHQFIALTISHMDCTVWNGSWIKDIVSKTVLALFRFDFPILSNEIIIWPLNNTNDASFATTTICTNIITTKYDVRYVMDIYNFLWPF